MKSKSFQLGKSPRLLFRSCSSDVRIHGWEQELVELSFRNKAKALNVQELEGALEISTTVPLTARVPPGTTVVLESCAGDLHATSFDALHVSKHRGDLSVDNVNRIEVTTGHGDVQVQEAQSLHVTTLCGDLRVRAVRDKVSVAGVHGDISLKQATGQLDLHNITGDLSIRDPEGHVDVHDIDGDLKLGGNLQGGQYDLETTGNVTVYLEPTSNARLHLEAPLGRIVCDLELSGVQESAHRLEGDLGKGTAQVKIVAHNGDIKVRQTRGNNLRHAIERERTRAEARVRREAKRAQRIAEKARRRSERLAQKAQDRATRLDRWHIEWSASRAGVTPKKLASERLAVLKMLSEGKIGAEQAEALLRALEG